MTVLAWDGTTLAADKNALDSFGLCSQTTKIQRVGNELFGMTGDYFIASEMLSWYRRGALTERFPESARQNTATLIVISKDGVCTFNTAPYAMPVENPFFAWGSGRDFAIAAMALGKTAREGVELASQFISDCGGGVDELRL